VSRVVRVYDGIVMDGFIVKAISTTCFSWVLAAADHGGFIDAQLKPRV
jgi:hypothetical protein